MTVADLESSVAASVLTLRVGFANELNQRSRFGRQKDERTEQKLYKVIDEIINKGADNTILTYRDITPV